MHLIPSLLLDLLQRSWMSICSMHHFWSYSKVVCCTGMQCQHNFLHPEKRWQDEISHLLWGAHLVISSKLGSVFEIFGLVGTFLFLFSFTFTFWFFTRYVYIRSFFPLQVSHSYFEMGFQQPGKIWACFAFTNLIGSVSTKEDLKKPKKSCQKSW